LVTVIVQTPALGPAVMASPEIVVELVPEPVTVGVPISEQALLVVTVAPVTKYVPVITNPGAEDVTGSVEGLRLVIVGPCAVIAIGGATADSPSGLVTVSTQEPTELPLVRVSPVMVLAGVHGLFTVAEPPTEQLLLELTVAPVSK
jgi:hypothetical protein